MSDLYCNLHKFSFIWNFHNEKVCAIISNVLYPNVLKCSPDPTQGFDIFAVFISSKS